MALKLWLISQDANNGYDSYDSAVVAAATADEAQRINPEGKWGIPYTAWCKEPEQVTVKLIGDAAPGIAAGIVL